MFFWKNENETPLSAAILHDDLETIKKLRGRKDHLYAKNSLGFNALKIAFYLGKRKYLEILKPQDKHRIKVLPPNENTIRLINEEDFEDFFQVKYLSHLKFEEYKQFKKVIKSCPAAFRQQLTEKERKQLLTENSVEYETAEAYIKLALQYKREILEGAVADVTIQWIDDVLGYGVFTNRDLQKGNFIGEYVGEVRRINRFRHHLNEYCLQYPLKKWFSSYVIDSEFQGNELRFVNHSYEPNLVPKAAADQGLLHSLFFANRDIPKGTQLTWDYGEDFWSYRKLPVDI